MVKIRKRQNKEYIKILITEYIKQYKSNSNKILFIADLLYDLLNIDIIVKKDFIIFEKNEQIIEMFNYRK